MNRMFDGKCDCCGAFASIYARLEYLDSSGGADDLCQNCIGLLKEMSAVSKLPVSEVVVLVKALHMINDRLDQLHVKLGIKAVGSEAD